MGLDDLFFRRGECERLRISQLFFMVSVRRSCQPSLFFSLSTFTLTWIKGKDNVTKEVSILWKDCNTFGMDCETLSIVSALQRKKWYIISKNITKRCSVMSCNATNASFSHLKSPLKDPGTPA